MGDSKKSNVWYFRCNLPIIYSLNIVFDVTNSVYHDKSLIFIKAIFREKIVSNQQAANINCSEVSSLWRLFIWRDKCRLTWQSFDLYQGYISGKARLPSASSEHKLLKMFKFMKIVLKSNLSWLHYEDCSVTVFDMINAVR